MSYQEVLDFQEKMIERYHYKALPGFFSDGAREFYKNNLPEGFYLMGDNVPLCTSEGLKICEKYNRIVVGDYGAFVEISPDDIVHENIKVKEGQEYRDFNEKYSHCKYSWLTAKDNSNIKIYFQKAMVDYADYIPGMYYVSPYECSFSKVLEKEGCSVENVKLAGWLKKQGVYTNEVFHYYSNMAEKYGNTLNIVVDNGFFPSDFDWWVRLNELCGTELSLEQYMCISFNLDVIQCSFKELGGLYKDLAADVKGAIYLGLSELSVPFNISTLPVDKIRFLLSLSVDNLLDVSKFCKIVAGCKGAELNKDCVCACVDELIQAAADRSVQEGSETRELEAVLE